MSDQDKTFVTFEPEIPSNWPQGHVKVELTDSNKSECMKVWIHGHTHYLHSRTARELQKMLEKKLAEWNEIATKHGVPTV